jgi:acyl-CoA thioesterase-2
MGSLDLDTRLSGGDGIYQATLSPDWQIWGPNGGYVAAVALRAAGLASRFRRPASFTCHFLGVGAFAPAEVRVVPQRSARTTRRAGWSTTSRACPKSRRLARSPPSRSWARSGCSSKLVPTSRPMG